MIKKKKVVLPIKVFKDDVVIWFLSFIKQEVPVPQLCKENGSTSSTNVICHKKW